MNDDQQKTELDSESGARIPYEVGLRVWVTRPGYKAVEIDVTYEDDAMVGDVSPVIHWLNEQRDAKNITFDMIRAGTHDAIEDQRRDEAFDRRVADKLNLSPEMTKLGVLVVANDAQGDDNQAGDGGFPDASDTLDNRARKLQASTNKDGEGNKDG